MKSPLPKLAKDLAALVGIARKETDPEKIEAALADARSQVETAIAEREAAEAAYRDGLLDASPAESERQLSEASAAKVKVDRAEALVAALAQRLTMARDELDRARRKAIHDEAAAKCAAIRDRLPAEYRHHATALRTLLRDLAEAEVARERAKDHFEEFGQIPSPEYGPRGLGGTPEEIVEEETVELWTINGRPQPLPPEHQKQVRQNPRTGAGEFYAPGSGTPFTCTRYRYKRIRYREAVSSPWNAGSLLQHVNLPAFHAYADDFATAERNRGPLTTLEHLARERVDQHKHERPVLERLEMVFEKREDGASVAAPLRSVA